jgi:PleD family two-component response regulator
MLKDESFKTWSADLQRTGEILVVDDMESNIRLLSNILVSIGHKVRTALNGELALMSIRSQAPDVVLLDIRMPKIDGYEVCRRIKADPATSDIPVIFISALNDTDDIVRAFEVGGVDYITKPFKLKEVLARVSTQITLSQQRKQIEENR